MKYALIGCGRIAVNHIKAMVNNGLDLVALCDLDINKIDLLLKKTNVSTSAPKYADYKQMLSEHPEIELVAIATDSGCHAEIALHCLENSKNVIVEKPMAMSIDDAELMIKKADEKNVKLCVCHQNRFNVAVQELRNAIDAGEFGKLSHGSINIRWNRNRDYYAQATWRGKWATDGGALMNHCIHGIDLLRWMMGDEIEEIYGTTRQQFHDYLECEDVGVAIVKFKNGAIATIEGTVNVYPNNLEETLYIFGEKGTVKLGGTSCNNIDYWVFQNERINTKEGIKEETSNVYGNGHTSLYANMIDSILENKKPLVDGCAGKNALEVVLAIYKSQLTGKPVKLPLKNFKSIDLEGVFGEGSL